MLLVNLHCHSLFSDGRLDPAGIYKRAAESGIDFLSVTDHDTVDAWKDTSFLADGGPECVTGVEINTCCHDNFHVLGYGVDPRNDSLDENLGRYRERRKERVREMIRLLRRENVDIVFEDVDVSSCSLGRPHVADALVKKKIFSSRKNAFYAYLAPGKSAYVPSLGPPPREAIEIIKKAGGLAVLAHPGLVKNIIDIGELKEEGLDGVEVFYPGHSRELANELLELAGRYSLFVTGGTDFHGPGSGRDEFYGYKIEKRSMGPLMEKVV